MQRERLNLRHEFLPVDSDLHLRQLHPAEAGRLFELVDSNREHLGTWLPWVKDVRSEQDSLEFIEASRADRTAGLTFGYGIVHKDKIVGHISLMNVSEIEEKIPEIGYWIDSASAGQGITTRAVQALTTFATDTLGIDQILITAQPENIASNKVAEKSGYQFAGLGKNPEYGYLLNIWSYRV